MVQCLNSLSLLWELSSTNPILACVVSCRSVGSWDLTSPEDATGWRHIRLKTTGPNASGTTHYLSVSGLEIYGEVRGLADEDLGE